MTLKIVFESMGFRAQWINLSVGTVLTGLMLLNIVQWPTAKYYRASHKVYLGIGKHSKAHMEV